MWNKWRIINPFKAPCLREVMITNLLDLKGHAKESAESVLTQIGTMKKAILARAFRSKLGTNNPAEEWSGEMAKFAVGE